MAVHDDRSPARHNQERTTPAVALDRLGMSVRLGAAGGTLAPKSEAGNVSPRLEFRIMGPLEVLREDRTVDLGAPRQRAVLAVMLLRANEVVPRERLIDEIWGEGVPASAPNMIQVYVSGLRKALGGGVLLTQAGGYVLRVTEAQVDAARFTALVAQARDAMTNRRTGDARSILEDATHLWRGPPLAEFTYESFAQGEIARLEELRLEAIELRNDADLALGQHARLVGELEQLVALYPFRERLRGQLMLALYRSGRQTEALNAYRAARNTLVEELGIEPAVELRELEQAILTQVAELGSGRAERPLAPPVSNCPSGGNLPAELTRLIGRDADIELVAALVAEHKLVTVVGPGGVGKTRVAARVARNLLERFEHGVRCVDLTAVDQDGDVAVALAAAVGIADRPGAATLDSVMHALVGRRTLLVLDNCEHVLSGSAYVAGRLATLCPGVRILATSREPLAIPGEQVVRLRPLATTPNGTAVPPAVELFLDRAATHGAAWEDPERMLPTIQEICARLDGIPLAIELAAARAAAMSPAQLLSRLDDRFRLLARPRHSSAAARQQTLEAAIAWSYDLLSAPERGTLRRLAVFQGGFFLAAAAAVCADIGSELDTVERVTALVDRSVVSIERRDDDDRYRLLESIGLFATSRLREQAEIGRARDRHAAFFLNLVRRAPDELHGREQPARVDQLDIEQDNIAHALAWCLDGKGDPDVGAELAAAIGWHWIGRGRSNLARRWLARALQLGEQVGAANLIALQVAYAVLAYATGNMTTAWTAARQAVTLARKLTATTCSPTDSTSLHSSTTHVARTRRREPQPQNCGRCNHDYRARALESMRCSGPPRLRSLRARRNRPPSTHPGPETSPVRPAIT